MTSTIISPIENYAAATPQQAIHRSSQYTLQWRRGQLLVRLPKKVKQPPIPSLDNEQLLAKCLQNSPVNLVSIDAKLGESVLEFWAEACKQAGKPIFLHTPPGSQLSKVSKQPWNWLWRLMDWVIAFVFLLFMSPAILVLAMLMRSDSPAPVFTYEWRVGERGRLFPAIKFRTTSYYNITLLERWLRKSSLDNLPQLWNVLQGDMSLMRYRSWTLEEVVRFSLEGNG
ncbi:heterocyst development glycosyltransferase HepC [Nostoc sp. TCL26-01]|uniref:heterocyst development glycosyltransferase HepC n=1 Tax=Nostoc sp. TCL26-01 TaxID=2576904 RepID=UPI0015B85CAD|nr:heterocyst development glycosyltransferase HepC [Nostoc sp. TCL26-01]QLE56094.1 sugar transferase [Nostoc sp. TCL26-01]